MMPGRRCNFDLRTIEPFDIDADAIGAHQLAFQLWRRYVNDPESRIRVTDIEVTATIAFDALCQLVDDSIRIVTVFDERYDRTALVAALRNAGEVLSSASAAVAADKADSVGLLNPAGPITPIGPDYVLLRRKRNPLLAAIRLGSVRATLSPAAQLTFDCGNRHSRYPIRENADRMWQRLPEHHPNLPELDPARIPQVLWPSTVWAGHGDTTTLAAAAQATALTKIGDLRPWTIIALDLGLPKAMATPVTQYWRQIVRGGRWPESLAALTNNLKERLRYNLPPIDYQQRRIIADDPRRLVLALTRAGANCRVMSRAELGDVIRRYWEHFTGGDIRYAAFPYALRAEEPAEWQQKRSRIDGEHDKIFRTAYELMATSNSLQPSGPLTWQPPRRPYAASPSEVREDVSDPPVYRRAGLKDLVTLTLLKLPPQESRPPSMAAPLSGIEAEISCWDTSKLILAARRLREDGTRGIRLGEIIDIHNHLVDGTHRTLSPDPSRDGRITARATHTLESDHALWSNILSNH